ncbi:unnamed protein product [Coregonus sp. 'balchen']|nr:unnamed protein product [Coregonus sp. 'balchen']
MSSPVFGTEISVLEGTSVTLVCTYPGAKKLDKCWSRASGTFQCTDPIKEEQSKYKVNAGDGTVNLTILNIQPADSGSYCCTVNVPRWFNDLIQIYSLRVVKVCSLTKSVLLVMSSCCLDVLYPVSLSDGLSGEIQYVLVTGCERDLLDGVDFLGNNVENKPFTTNNASQCRQKCTNNDKCQFFTFVGEKAEITEHSNKCFLKASTGDTPKITIQHLQHATSGYSLRNCSGKVTYSAQKYSLVPEMKNWTEVQEYCRQRFTNLSIIQTEEDWRAIKSTLGNFNGDVWIGLHREKPDPNEKWKWSDGEDFMFFNWGNGSGDHTRDHDCVLSISSHWVPVSCASPRPYMCQRVHHGNGTTEKVYELMTGPKDQNNSVTDCRTIQGREMASICNQKEQEAFDEVAKQEQIWIGLKNENNTWNWSSGEPFQEWDNSMGGGNCVKLNSENGRKWQPEKCSTQRAFLCYGDERPLNTTGDLSTPATPETTSPTSTGPPSSKTSTTPPTTTNRQSTTSPPTTTNGQSTTSPPTITNRQPTTSPPTTTNRQSTTSPPTITNRQSTTSPPTITNGQSTTSPPTITNGQSTTSPPTTTNRQSTTSPPTITNRQSTTSPPTITNRQSTTSPPTITNGQSTTSPPTITNRQPTTSPPTTTNRQSTTSPPTIANRQSTTSPPTITNRQSITSPPTTTNGQSTTSPPTITNGQSTTPPTSTSSGQLTSSGPTSPDRKPTSSPSSTTSPLHPDYLHYFNESKSWINALEFCKSRGSSSNLVHITNQTVQADVTQLLANVELPCGGVWIGLERSIFEWTAPWLWTSSAVEKVVEHRQWHSCFPLNPINYHCGKMVRVGNGELKWLDASCHQELPFICEDLH